MSIKVYPRADKGFTLIELLVVIAIIGILSSVVLVSLNTARDKARNARIMSDIGQIKRALELYYSDNGQYPANPSGTHVSNLNTSQRDITPYINPIPEHPVNTGTSNLGYRYRVGDPGGVDNRQSYTMLVRMIGGNGWCYTGVEPGHSIWTTTTSVDGYCGF